jgi:uncharacterized protein YndB with AHSA1/START domain
VVCEVRIAASPETVFPYFTDPARIVRWKGEEATLKPEAGGVYRVKMGENVVLGEYLEVDPPRRVVFTWGWEADSAPLGPGASTVEVELTADEGETVVTLTHRDLPDELRAPHEQGWVHYLGRLTIAATGGDPGPDPGPGG